MDYLLNNLEYKDKYRLLTNCIVPRPIAWVSSISKDGIYNAAPFSYFTGISIEPPLVLFAVERRNGEKKDTVINIENTKEFVINLVTENNIEQMNETSKDFEFGEDEIKMSGLTAVPSKYVKVPSILESPLHMECKLYDTMEIGSSPHSLVIGEVIAVTVNDEMISDGRIQINALQAIGRMGGKWYTKTDHLFELERLDWRKSELNE